MVLNAKRRKYGGTTCLNKYVPQVALRSDDGSEPRNENATLNVKRKRDMIALNVELRTNDGSERQTEEAALNVKMKIW